MDGSLGVAESKTEQIDKAPILVEVSKGGQHRKKFIEFDFHQNTFQKGGMWFYHAYQSNLSVQLLY